MSLGPIFITLKSDEQYLSNECSEEFIYFFFDQIIAMGNSSTSSSLLHNCQWIWVGNHTGIDVFKRQSDSLIAQRRLITLDTGFDLQNELQIYQFRSYNNHGFVRVYQVDGVQEQKKNRGHSSICSCSQSKKLNVYSQRIELRLSDLPQLTFPESLNILKQTLQSFHQIYQKFGPIHINSQLIGINDQNKVKVWVNQNWALNHPSHKIPILLTINNLHLPPQLRDQREMVINIVQVIEQKTEQGKFPFQFGEGIYTNSVNFRQAKRFLAKYIDQDYKDYIPAIIKRSTVLASRHQISQYNSPTSLPLSKQNNHPFCQQNDVRIVLSTYHQYKNTNISIPFEKKNRQFSYPTPLIQTISLNSNPPTTQGINSPQNYTFTHNNSVPISTHKVQNIERKIHNISIQKADSPNFQSRPYSNQFTSQNFSQWQKYKSLSVPSHTFNYLKFELIQDYSQPLKYQQENELETQTRNFLPQNDSQALRLNVSSDLSQTIQHKAYYKIMQPKVKFQVPPLRGK